MVRSGGICFALVVGAACAVPPPPDPWTLWTIDALEARGDPAVIEPGAGLRLLQSPYPLVGSKSGVQQSGRRGLTVFPAFSEGQPAAYMTTEIWRNFDEVYVQPLYVDTTRKNPAIFGVDSSTRFYGPYWQVFTYALPAGQSFRSAKDVLDSRVALAPNTGKFCAITRDATLLAAIQDGDSGPVRPLTGEPVGAPKNGHALADGNDVSFIDLGNAQRFTFNAMLEVEQTPLFAFALPDASGNPVEVDLPKVGGTGPLHSPRCDGKGNCSGMTGNVPEFGSLWRIYDVLLPTGPTGADVYVPKANAALQSSVRAMGFAATETATPLPDAYILRVALNGKACLSTAPATCKWLDSQNALEAMIADWRITKTGTMVTCPLVLFNGNAIGAP
jgi:hypothetical protein